MALSSRAAFVAVLLTGVVGTGLLVMVLADAGYGTLGNVVWIAGYGGMVLVLWYGWIRPLDLGNSPDGDGDASGRERL
jgi:hypothetical protein